MKLRLFALVALSAVLAAPVYAFEPLDRYLPALPANLNEATIVFTYTSPHSLQMSEMGKTAPIGTSDHGLNTALYDGPTAKALTGIDFDLVDGILAAGDPPYNVTVLIGSDGFAADAPKVLAAAGYTQSVNTGLLLLSRGEDYKVDVAHQDDLLGSDLGKSVRLAIGNGFVLRTAATEGVDYVLAAMDKPQACVSCKFWKALFDALNTASGTNSHLEAASGFTPPAFFTPGDVTDADADPSTDPSQLPQFGLVILAATSTDNSNTAHIAVIFPTDSDARTGAKMISDRLLAQPVPQNSRPTAPRIAITPGPGGNIAVISVDFPGNDPDAVDTYLGWLAQIYGRGFPPLALAN